MNFYFNELTDFISLCNAYSTFMRVFYWHNTVTGNFAVYGFPATMPFVLIAEDGASATATLLASFPSAIQLSESIDVSGRTTGTGNWADYKLVIDGLTDPLNPPQVTYYSQDGVYYFFTLDPPTKTCLTCIERNPPTGLDAIILAAYPSVVHFTEPVMILESGG
jgi:hypothetical protein